MQVVSTQEDFDKICEELSKEKILFIDTEFCRRRTYYAILSVIQIASQNHEVIIDVLSGINIKSLNEIFSNEKIVKVLHSADQDFDIFYHMSGKLPKNVLDTQIAAGVIGLDAGIGYARLCKTLLHINIDKTLQKADWLKRPLEKNLLNYAIKDVEYLIPLHRELSKTITERNLWDTYELRSKKLLSEESYKTQPEKIMKRMNLYRVPDYIKKNLPYFIELREECAKELDIPRGYCASDRDLIEICEKLPTTDRVLLNLRIQNKLITKRKFKDKLLELCSGLRET
ncbi:HRDC domain-containing protein [Rickettsiaceae bacterium]|nr:HRDC domain-containing protein [Rickettsiaceae bacterium]